uniref:Uncharacterized protein n=1 Tax=Anguilla anguilla TaxID=7936 RepID=A0A0E9TNG0_ANGAN
MSQSPLSTLHKMLLSVRYY